MREIPKHSKTKNSPYYVLNAGFVTIQSINTYNHSTDDMLFTLMANSFISLLSPHPHEASICVENGCFFLE